MTIKTTRLKSTQAPKVEALDLTPQLDGRTQTFSLPRKVHDYDRHYIVWNSTVYHNDANHSYYTISSDGRAVTTHFDRAPSPSTAHTLQLVVDMAGDSTDNVATKDDIELAVTREANLREAADEKLDANIKAEAAERVAGDTKLTADLATETANREAGDTKLAGDIESEAQAREECDEKLQEQLDALSSASDVKDIVQSHKDLDNYDKSSLGDNDVIKVLKDEEQNDATTYYRYNTGSKIFDLIGSVGPYYTTSEVDKKLEDAAREVDATKQDKLVSGENIKTLNGESILGPGNIEVKGGGGSGDIDVDAISKVVNGNRLLKRTVLVDDVMNYGEEFSYEEKDAASINWDNVNIGSKISEETVPVGTKFVQAPKDDMMGGGWMDIVDEAMSHFYLVYKGGPFNSKDSYDIYSIDFDEIAEYAQYFYYQYWTGIPENHKDDSDYYYYTCSFALSSEPEVAQVWNGNGNVAKVDSLDPLTIGLYYDRSLIEQFDAADGDYLYDTDFMRRQISTDGTFHMFDYSPQDVNNLAQVYLSNSGDEFGDGSKEKPFNTFTQVYSYLDLMHPLLSKFTDAIYLNWLDGSDSLIVGAGGCRIDGYEAPEWTKKLHIELPSGVNGSYSFSMKPVGITGMSLYGLHGAMYVYPNEEDTDTRGVYTYLEGAKNKLDLQCMPIYGNDGPKLCVDLREYAGPSTIGGVFSEVIKRVSNSAGGPEVIVYTSCCAPGADIQNATAVQHVGTYGTHFSLSGRGGKVQKVSYSGNKITLDITVEGAGNNYGGLYTTMADPLVIDDQAASDWTAEINLTKSYYSNAYLLYIDLSQIANRVTFNVNNALNHDVYFLNATDRITINRTGGNAGKIHKLMYNQADI